MTKTQHQQELLKKIKPGIKPSDFKKPHQNLDEGYESDNQSTQKLNQKPNPESILSPPIEIEPEQATIRDKSPHQNPTISLHYELTLLTRMEELQSQNKSLLEKINQLENQTKITTKKPEPTPPPTFFCSSCTHTLNIELIRLAKKSGQKICRNCTLLMLKRANQLTGKHIVLKIKKQPEPQTKTFTCQTCLQPSPGEPHQVHITNFQDQGIVPQQLTSICSPCLENKVSLANFYCPRTSEGKDT